MADSKRISRFSFESEDTMLRLKLALTGVYCPRLIGELLLLLKPCEPKMLDSSEFSFSRYCCLMETMDTGMIMCLCDASLCSSSTSNLISQANSSDLLFISFICDSWSLFSTFCMFLTYSTIEPSHCSFSIPFWDVADFKERADLGAARNALRISDCRLSANFCLETG